MIGKECKHNETGHFGKITKELNGTKDFPDQWGVNWYSGKDGKKHAKHIKSFGLAHYWNDKEKITLSGYECRIR